MLTITVTDNASPVLKRLAAIISPDSAHAIAARAAVNTVRNHFFALQQSNANRQGWPRQNYWAGAARSVEYTSDSAAAIVKIHQPGISLKYHGGTIRPVNAKMLTIPAVPEAYGKRAGEFNNLEIAFGRDRKMVGLREKTRDGSGRMFYWLVRSATVQADPSVVPSEQTITTDVIAALADAVRAGIK